MADLAVYTDVKSLLKIATADTTYDTLLAALVTAVSDAVERWCKRSFITATYTDEVHDGKGEYVILKNYPLDTATAPVVKIYSDNTTYTTASTSDYYVDYTNGVLFWDGGWEEGSYNVKVTYKAGLGAAYSNLPKSLQMAVWLWCVYIFEAGGAAGIGDQRLGDYSITSEMLDRPPSHVQGLLNMFKSREVM